MKSQYQKTLVKSANPQKLKIKGLTIKQNDSDIDYKKLQTKSIYYHCLYPTSKPNCIETWEHEFGECNWKKIWKIVNNPISHNKKKQLHWKSVHRAIYSETRLERMGKSNGVCTLCKIQDENILHLFVTCTKIKHVWSQIGLWLSDLVNEPIVLNDQVKCFGMWKEELKEVNHIINLVIIETKWRIWKNRNSVKYGNEKCEELEKLINDIKIGTKEDIRNFALSKLHKRIKTKLNPIIDVLL